MERTRIRRPRVRRERPGHAALPPDPRDPDVVRAKALARAAAPGRARLRAYMESNLAFMAGHRAQITAVAEVLNALPRHGEGQAAAYAPLHARGLEPLAGSLREGQAIGQLRRFQPDVMAQTIRAAIDAVGYRLAGEPGLDLAAWARELADLFDHAASISPPGADRTETT